MAQNPAQVNKMVKNFSTYGLLIPQSICSKLKIKVDPRDLIKAVQDDTSVYHVICLAPIQDMYNGIILAQIKSYQVFIQKRLIDGYVSSAPTISEVEASGQEPAENETMNLMKDDFLQHIEATKPIEQAHYDLIADSYGALRRYVATNKGQLKICTPKLRSTIDNFLEQGKILETQLIELRLKWREHAIEVSDYIMKMGSGRIDDLHDLEQRAELDFLQSFGESN